MADLPISFGFARDGYTSACHGDSAGDGASECLRTKALPDDPHAEMENAFCYGSDIDEMTEREIDELFVEEMARREREASSKESSETLESGPAAEQEHSIYSGQLSGSSDDALIALLRAVMNNEPNLIDLGYTNTEHRKRMFLGEILSEILIRLCPTTAEGTRGTRESSVGKMHATNTLVPATADPLRSLVVAPPMDNGRDESLCS